MHGNLGVSLLPGSPVVLDRDNNTLVPCTLERCPLATTKTLDASTATEQLVNTSPGLEVVIIPINNQSSDKYKFLAFNTMVRTPEIIDCKEFIKGIPAQIWLLLLPVSD